MESVLRRQSRMKQVQLSISLIVILSFEMVKLVKREMELSSILLSI